MMPVPATVYVLKRKHSMWGLAKSVFKFGAGESNDNTVDDSSLVRSSQSEKEDHTTMPLTREKASSAKRRREFQESQARLWRKREERAYERAEVNVSRAGRAAKNGEALDWIILRRRRCTMLGRL
jgi:hypothetical protein